MKLENLGELNNLYNFQDTIFCVRYLKTNHNSYKSYSNITQKSVILRVPSVAVSKGAFQNLTSTKKIENPYVPPLPQDAQTIENETKNKFDDFLKTVSEFNKVEAAATKQERDDYYDKLFDDIMDKGNRRQIIDDIVKTEVIFIGDNYLFDNDDTQETNICDQVLDDIDTNHVLFEHVPVDDMPNYPSPSNPLPSFSNILLPKNKSKKKAAKNFFKKVPKIDAKQRKDKKCSKKKKRYPKTKKSKVSPNR